MRRESQSLPRLGMTRPQTTRGAVRTGRRPADHRLRVKSRLLTRTENAQSTRHGPPTSRATARPRMPRAQERPASLRVVCALVLVSPRSPWVSWPRRLSAPSGSGIRAVCACASEEPRMHDPAGYAARTSRAEVALPTDSPGTLSRRVRCALTKLARRCLSERLAPARGAKSRALTYSLTYQSPRASIHFYLPT
ncbi:hypothetical protein FB451DRAFT_298372 [Mycena latifolia]|nr:hypothetical protein FB451DRAFT_298372 [Mycena latifolia]